MRYIYVFLKLIVLGVLITASLYQTGKLWFEDTSDRNFFYDVEKTVANLDQGLIAGSDFLIPEQMGVYFVNANIEYTLISYGANSYDNVQASSVNVISTMFDKGTYIETVAGAEDLWKRRHLLLVLPFGYSAGDLAEGFGLPESKVKGITNVDSVYVLPAEAEERSIHMYFENNETGELSVYKLNKEEAYIDNEVLIHYLAEVLPEQSNPAYISTRKNQLQIFDRTILLPMVSNDIRYHKNLYWEVPYILQDGQIDKEGVKQLVRPFFDNPDVLTAVDFEDEVRFITDNRSVSYDPRGLLEYTLTSEVSNRTRVTEAMGLSQKFLKQVTKDTTLEFYLTGYEETDRGVSVKYDLGYNGFPIVMNDGTRDAYGMDHGVEILVNGQQVVKLKMLLRMIPERMPQFDVLDMSFSNALDNMIAVEGNGDVPIDDMYLAYRWDDTRSGMSLHWVVQRDQDTYMVDVEGR